jgi:hypothetical protein
LPAAHFGTRPSAAGLLTDVDQTVIESASSIAPNENDEYLTKVVTSRGISWALRIHGSLPKSVQDSQFLNQFTAIQQSGNGGGSGVQNPLLDKPLSSLLRQKKYLPMPKIIPSSRSYLTVSSYDRDILPLDSLLVIDADSGVTFGWLSSNAFWLWTQTVSSNAPSATIYTAYNSFPAPALSRKNKEILESAANTVLRSRGHFLETSLTQLYDVVPDQLLWAHQELDAVVNRLFDLADDASDTEVIDILIERYSFLAAA